MSRVCRLGVGDRVEVFDGKGFASQAEVIAVRNDGVELAVVGDRLPECRPPLSLTRATAIPKGDRFDWLVEKATELGVERLIPIITDRSVVEPRDAKLARLRKSIIEASKQSRRDRLMLLANPTPWPDLAKTCPENLKFLADPDGLPSPNWPEVQKGRATILAVGPEGGFTVPEKELAAERGWLAIRLSVNTLRIETAGLVGCASLFTRCREESDE